MNCFIGKFIKTSHYQNGVCQIIETDTLTKESIKKQNVNPEEYITVVSTINHLTIIFKKYEIKELSSQEELAHIISEYDNIIINNTNLLWSEKYRELTSLLKENTIKNVLIVIKDILTSKKVHTFGQLKLLELACSIFINEYSIVYETDKTQAYALLQKITHHNLQTVKYY
jgi:RNA polymerase-interacting CarD/CdnL/TRCF family regulator